MFSLKASLNRACEEMGRYNDTHLLALLVCVCVCVCARACVWGQFLVNYCFLLEPFPCERPRLGLVPHSENDPWPAHRTGNVVSVMRMPNVPRVEMQQKPGLTSRYSAVHSDRGNLSHMQLLAGAECSAEGAHSLELRSSTPCAFIAVRSWWWTGRPGVLRCMGLQRIGLIWSDLIWSLPGQNW